MTANRALMNPDILRIHAENAAFLATLRRRALDGPNFRLIDIYDFESRLRGHLDALVLCGDAGSAAAEAELARQPGYGEVFAAAHVALRRRDGATLAVVLDLAASSTECAEAVAAAAAFCDPADVAEHMRAWIAGASPARIWIALEVCGLRRVDPRDQLARLIALSDGRVAARASELAGELGRADLLPAILPRVADQGELGFAAARSACLLGDRGPAPERLAAALHPGVAPGDARRAAELVPLVVPAERARLLARRLVEHDATRRWGVVALGSLGAASTLDWLVSRMGEPLLARVAGAAFALVTGGRLGPNNLELEVFPDAPDDPLVESDPQEAFIETHLYWPDPERVAGWLEANRSRFREDTRYLLGQPAWTHLDPPDRPANYQLEYRAVALELALRKPSAPLPNWRAPVTLSHGSFTRRW